jgi:hypothetical protein
MDSNTLLTVGFVVLVAAALFVTVRAGAVAAGVLPPATRGRDGTEADGATTAETEAEAAEDASADRDDADRSRITAADHERIRSHLEKDRFHRRPDDLLPSDDDDGS